MNVSFLSSLAVGLVSEGSAIAARTSISRDFETPESVMTAEDFVSSLPGAGTTLGVMNSSNVVKTLSD